LTKKVPSCAHSTAHLVATCSNAFCLAYDILVMTEMFGDIILMV